MPSLGKPIPMDPDAGITEADIQWFMKDFDMDRQTVCEVLDALDPGCVKEEFWKLNPTLPENVVDNVVRKNVSASVDYHLYRTFNNEAS